MSVRSRLSSLRYRIALTVFLLETIMVLLVLWQTLAFSRQQMEQQIDASEEAIMELLGSLGSVALFTVEFDETQGYINTMRSDPKVLAIVLANDRKVVVASDDMTLLGQPMPERRNTLATHWRVRSLNGLGTLAVQFSREALISANKAARNRGILIAVTGMLIILAVGLFIGYWLTRRLTTLTQAARYFEEGKPDIHTDFSGGDEISELGRTFEHMRNTIEHNIQELETRSRELTRYSVELESYSYSLVHDLRTPVRGITSFAQVLTDEAAASLNDEHRYILQRIAAAGNRMAQTIDDMSDLGRVARRPIQYVSVDISDMAARLVDNLRADSPARDVTVDIQPDIRAWGDRKLLQKALEQLIGNAWKFTCQQHPAHIRVGVEQRDLGAVYFVADNGVGLSMEYAETIFEPFQRLHQEECYQGSGIGLVISSRIIGRHGGRLWVESEEGKGASFFFTLPGPPAVAA
jgi:signal transduction histidine kinase